MSTTPLSEQFRNRARHLRDVSAIIAASPALTVCTLATPDTWVGPTPQACYDSLVDVRRRLQAQHDTLIRTATAFERRAAELDALAARAVILS